MTVGPDHSLLGSLGEPKVSVVIPVHNGARFLAETLHSLYQQTFDRFEVIVVDDASTDNLKDVLASCGDPRLRVVHLLKNVGVSAARNAGIEQAVGQYIAFCDGDDICMPSRLEAQLARFERSETLGLCGSAFVCFDEQDRETVQNPREHNQIRKALMAGNCFGLSTVMVRASLLRQNSFNPDLGVAEDFDLWTRLVSAGVVAENLPDVLVRYRLHPQQASRSKGEKLDLVSRRIRAQYGARLLGGEAWVKRLDAELGSLKLLQEAASAVLDFVQNHPDFSPRDFRFLLAWIFQELHEHSWGAWWRWCRVRKELNLRLNATYRINIWLLTAMPSSWGRQRRLHLAKLKR